MNCNNPLNPSTKFAPLIINKKQTRTKIDENKLFVNKNFKKEISILLILIGNK